MFNKILFNEPQSEDENKETKSWLYEFNPSDEGGDEEISEENLEKTEEGVAVCL